MTIHTPNPRDTWCPGLDNGRRTLAEVFTTMPGDPASSVPWYVRLLENPKTLPHLGHPQVIPGKTIPGCRAANLKIEIGIRQIRLILPQIAGHTAGTGHWSRGAAVRRPLLRQHTDAFCPIDEDAIAVQEPLHIVERLRKGFDECADLLDDQRRKVIRQAADPSQARMKSLAGKRLENVVYDFSLIKRVQEESERPDV